MGLLNDNVAVIIGAMVIAPLLGPIIAQAMGLNAHLVHHAVEIEAPLVHRAGSVLRVAPVADFQGGGG